MLNLLHSRGSRKSNPSITNQRSNLTPWIQQEKQGNGAKTDKIQNPSSNRESIMHKCTKNKIKNETYLENERIMPGCSKYNIYKKHFRNEKV